jgi:hypothetical protein
MRAYKLTCFPSFTFETLPIQANLLIWILRQILNILFSFGFVVPNILIKEQQQCAIQIKILELISSSEELL